MKPSINLTFSAIILTLSIIIDGCSPSQNNDQQASSGKLPVMGPGENHTISPFTFVNQNGDTITQADFNDKIYVADFFFTTCPTICPKMKQQMLRVYKKYKDNSRVGILSHTIDPKHDSVEVLKDFAEKLEVSTPGWHFVTGQQDSIYSIGKNSYMVTAREAPDQPGGLLHSGAFILVDKNKQVRGMYDGTKPGEVEQLMHDIDRLLKQQFTNKEAYNN